METPTDDYDAPWKEALGEYLRECLELLFPAVHAAVDWARPYAFLDTELQQAGRAAAVGPRRADRLVRVWLVGGEEAWLLVHVEVQSQEVPGFPERMFVYNYRVFDDHHHEVISLAILGDERLGWRPDTYRRGLLGFELWMRYPVAKLADWRAQPEALEESDNPFAVVVLAHLAAQDTRGDADRRAVAKLGLIRRLYERGYDRERVLSLFGFIDWLLALPPEHAARVLREVEAIEEERKMPYVTSAERIGVERGKQEGLEQGRVEGKQQGRVEGKRLAVREIVRARFGGVPDELDARLASIDEAALDGMIRRVGTVVSVADL